MSIDYQKMRDAVLNEDDFGHEVRAGRILKSIPGATLQHGGTYTDDISGKPRQYDFRVEVERAHCIFRLAIECKRLSAGAPLVICGTMRRPSEAYHELIVSRSSCSGVGDTFAKDSYSFRVNVPTSAYAENEFVGKSLLRLALKNAKGAADKSFTSVSDSDVYDRWAQALSSSKEMCERAAISNAGRNRQSHPAMTSAIVPMVIVPDGTLWKVEYDEDGNIGQGPIATDGTSFYVGREFQIQMSPKHEHSIRISHIHFLTLSGLKGWVANLGEFGAPPDHAIPPLRERWFPSEKLKGLASM